MKNFKEINGSEHLNIIFNQLIETVEHMNSKIIGKTILEVSRDLKIYFYTVFVHRTKKIIHLNSCCILYPKKSKTLYSGHLDIADTFLRRRRCLLKTGFTVKQISFAVWILQARQLNFSRKFCGALNLKYYLAVPVTILNHQLLFVIG